jgi:hypothetical protein
MGISHLPIHQPSILVDLFSPMKAQYQAHKMGTQAQYA